MIHFHSNCRIEFRQNEHTFEEALHQIILPNIHAIFIWNIVFTFSDHFMANITKLLEKY